MSMEINTSYSTSAATAAGSTSAAAKSADTKAAEETKSTASAAATYDKSDAKSTEKATYSNPSAQTDRSSIIAKMKADTQARTQQLQSLVEKMFSNQGKTLAKADDMWSFLAGGDFTVDAATKQQAQADIAEDGYWGAEQTSDRILSFAKALAGDDPEKADELLNAFKKGYEQATKAWGGQLPDLSKNTYDLVAKKFDNWKNGVEE